MTQSLKKQRSPRLAAAMVTGVLTIFLGLGALLGSAGAAQPNNSPLGILGVGAFFVVAGIIYITTSPSYGRLSGFLFGWLGSLTIAAGVVFLDGGLAALLMPTIPFFGMWCLQMLGVFAVAMAVSVFWMGRPATKAPRLGLVEAFMTPLGWRWCAGFSLAATLTLLLLDFAVQR